MTILQFVFIIYAIALSVFCISGAMGVYSKKGINDKMFKIFLVGLVVLIVFAGIVIARA